MQKFLIVLGEYFDLRNEIRERFGEYVCEDVERGYYTNDDEQKLADDFNLAVFDVKEAFREMCKSIEEN